MHPSRLPYELQFKILKQLPIEEVYSYCRAERAAWQIWLDEDFWEQRARKNFGLSLSHVEGESPSAQYRELVRLEQEEPVILFVLAISQEALKEIPRYFRQVRLKTSKYKPLLKMIMDELAEEGSQELFDLLHGLDHSSTR